MSLTTEHLRTVLHYDPETGVFTWLRNQARARAGKRAGCNDVLYRTIGIDGDIHLEHRLVWLWMYGHWPENNIDHINGEGHDNRRANLRDVNQRVNVQNRRVKSDNASGFLGVSRAKKRWRAVININGRNKWLGTFVTPEEASACYLEAKRRHHEGCSI